MIVAESGTVTIYDGDDPDMPMWMVFNGNAGIIYYTHAISSVTMLNGILAIGRPVSYAVGLTNFVSDSSQNIRNHFGTYTYNGSIVDRNASSGQALDSANPLVNGNANDVAMTVLPNAPIDAATGLPVPTIAVATDGGVSVIKDNGSVVDIVSSYLGHETPMQVKFVGDKVFWLGQNNYDNGWSSAFTAKIPGADLSVNYNSGVGSLTKYSSKEWSVHLTNGSDISIPIAMNSPRTSVLIETGTNDELILGGKGADDHGTVVKVVENLSNPESGMLAQIASDYNTGYQVGDIKLATLSDTDTTNAVGAELVTNGDFASDTSWTKGAGWTISGGGAVASNVQSGIKIRSTSFTLATGWHTITVDVNTSASTYYFGVDGTTNDNTGVLSTQGKASFTVYLLAGTYTAYIGAWSSGLSGTFDNFSVRKAEQDRSWNGNGLQVFGTVTKTAVATGADLVGCSGFTTSNYLLQPYNAALNFTNEFSISFWVKNWSAGQDLLHRGPGQTRNSKTSFHMYCDGGYDYRLTLTSNGSSEQTFEIPLSGNLTGWQNVCFTLTPDGAVRGYLNGRLEFTGAFTGTNIFTQATDQNGLYIGHGPVSAAFGGSLALLRLSATAPTAEQIKKMYNDEKHLFATNAKATLYGTSNAVTALAYDDDTELLHAGTSAGRSVFQGLNRVDNTTDAVGAAISASNGLVAED